MGYADEPFRFELQAAACSVLSSNLHIIGRELLVRQRARGDTLALAG